MKIAVCDDDNSYAERIRDMITDTIPDIFQSGAGYEFTYKIDVYNSLSSFMSSSIYYDIVFMDIFMAETNSIEVISETDNRSYSCIVFITSSDDYAVKAFSLNAVHYIVKPVQQRDIHEALDRCRMRLIHNLRNTLNISTEDGIVPIDLNSLIYIEIYNKTCLFHTEYAIYKSFSSLSSLEHELDTNGFMRAQRSYIVNMRHIRDFFFDHIILSDGMDITLSRRNRSKLKKQYQDYMFNLSRSSNQ